MSELSKLAAALALSAWPLHAMAENPHVTYHVDGHECHCKQWSSPTRVIGRGEDKIIPGKCMFWQCPVSPIGRTRTQTHHYTGHQTGRIEIR